MIRVVNAKHDKTLILNDDFTARLVDGMGRVTLLEREDVEMLLDAVIQKSRQECKRARKVPHATAKGVRDAL